MANIDDSSFDMSALMDACKEISKNHEVEEKLKKTNLFLRHVMDAYDEVIEEGENGKEQISERFLKKLKKTKKREPSSKQNRRRNLEKGKGESYAEKMNQKLLKKKRNLKTKRRMSVYELITGNCQFVCLCVCLMSVMNCEMRLISLLNFASWSYSRSMRMIVYEGL